MKRDNRGLSLVEIIVVVAIMAALGGSIIIGVGLATGRPADECAAKLQSILQSSRLSAMGKVDNKIEIYMNAEGYIYVKETVTTATGNGAGSGMADRVTETRIGERGITFVYTLSNHSTGTLTPGGASLVLSFDRSSGAFNGLEGYPTPVYCESITISRGSREKTLTLSSLTGKVSLK